MDISNQNVFVINLSRRTNVNSQPVFIDINHEGLAARLIIQEGHSGAT